jgi:2-keto-4-pentenoate hydratase/2-oxohepta-3-ene-1,7-dioic acid hydratase in catechol pathway
MKLLSYCRMGETSFGIGKKDGVIDLGLRLKNKLPDKTISNFLSIFDFKYLERFANLSVDYFYSDITFLPVIPNPNKILCIGLNYEKHRIETKRDVAGHPTIFTRFADTQVAHNQYLVKPNASDRFDFEGELAIIIGKGGRNIPKETAMNHIAGYSCYNDGSIRDWQRHTSQFTPGKNFPQTGAFGPFLTLKETIKNYKKLTIQTRLNDVIVQDAVLDQLIFDIPSIISYCSSFNCLNIGDVIVTGTPGGVGDRREPPLYLKKGDIIEVDISEVGLLRNFVINESEILT